MRARAERLERERRRALAAAWHAAMFHAAASVGKLPDLREILDPPPPDDRTADSLASDFAELDNEAEILNRSLRKT